MSKTATLLAARNGHLEGLGFITLQRYLLNNGWNKRESKREGISIFSTQQPEYTEFILANTKDYSDYYELIYSAIDVIAKLESRTANGVINELLLPPADTIRFRVNNRSTSEGLISLSDAFTLLENAKKSLFLAACDFNNPTHYHKRPADRKAQQFIDACKLGQTERGSFVASIVCPMIDVNNNETSQLSIFSDDELLAGSFTRKVTNKYMSSLHQIKNAIETNNFNALEADNSDQIISANFIESILAISEFTEGGTIEINASLLGLNKQQPAIYQSVTFDREFIAPMRSIVAHLKPKDLVTEDSFVGRIDKAQILPVKQATDKREITFVFIDGDRKTQKAKVTLSIDDFSKALEALDKRLNVKITGNLVVSGKNKTIENPIFELID